MCGTDYNKNIFKVGPIKAYSLIKEHKNIDNIPVDVSVLNHERVRHLFKNYEKLDIDSIEYCGIPDHKEVELFMVENNVRIDINTFMKNIVNNPLFVSTEVMDDIS